MHQNAGIRCHKTFPTNTSRSSYFESNLHEEVAQSALSAVPEGGSGLMH